MPDLNFRNLRGDIYGGITVAVVALPLALAMGLASGAGAIAGVYGAICVGFFAALFGGTPAQVSGPTGPMTVVMATVFAHYAMLFPDNPIQSLTLAFSVVVLGGLFQILFGMLKVGRYIEFVPHAVISGFMSGIGVIIILLQIGPLLGYASPSKPLAAAEAAPAFLAQPNMAALFLGGVTLLIVYTLPRFLPAVNRLLPAPLAALILGTLIYLLWLPSGSTPLLGTIPGGLPDLHLPVIELSLLPDMLKYALILAALGAIDSLLTSLVADNITRTFHDPNRELIGQGIGNTVAGLFGGLPGAGATMRTVVNVKAGGKTPLSGALHALILLAVILGAGTLAEEIPKAVLAGILVKVGTDIIDWDYLKRLRNISKAGVSMMITVLLMTVFVDLIMAVAVGMVMASFVFMSRMTELQLQSISATTRPNEVHHLSEAENAILEAAQGRILYFHLGGAMSFAAAKGMSRHLAAFDGYDALVLDLSDVPQIDYTTSRALDDMIFDAQHTGRLVFLSGARRQVREMLNNQKVLAHLADGHEHRHRLEALKHARALLSD